MSRSQRSVRMKHRLLRSRTRGGVIAIVGAGAAGLATAIFAVRRGAREPVLLFEGAKRPGAKILVSGGARCNVTNAAVSERDFSGSSPHLVRRVLRGFGVEPTVAFFREIGVPLHEEEHGKLFPDANRSRVVLEALLAEADRLGVDGYGRGSACARSSRAMEASECERRAATTTLHGSCSRRAGCRCRRRAATARGSSSPGPLATRWFPPRRHWCRWSWAARFTLGSRAWRFRSSSCCAQAEGGPLAARARCSSPTSG